MAAFPLFSYITVTSQVRSITSTESELSGYIKISSISKVERKRKGKGRVEERWSEAYLSSFQILVTPSRGWRRSCPQAQTWHQVWVYTGAWPATWACDHTRVKTRSTRNAMVLWSNGNIRLALALRLRIANNDRQPRMRYNLTGDITVSPVLRLSPSWSGHRCSRCVPWNIWRGRGYRWPSWTGPWRHSQRWSKKGSLEWSRSDKPHAIGQKLPLTLL